MTQVSVYIPAYNAARTLALCIEGLLGQTHPPHEILVIDDGSQDETAEIARRYAQVTLVQHGTNLGLGAARNTAFGMARNDIVASLDADCIADAPWLECLLVNMSDERVAGAGGRLVEGVRESLADRWRCAHMLQEWGTERIANPLFLFGCNNVFRKSAVLDVGGYNEAMRTNGEDAEVSRLLKARGWHLVYDPLAQVTHMRHDTVSSILNAYWRWTFYGFPKPMERLKLAKIARRSVLGNIRYMFGRLAWSDLSSCRMDLLCLDIMLLFYFPYRELREWRRLKRAEMTFP
jgi:glycosyltransferase involved in cell wall biosynthesis